MEPTANDSIGDHRSRSRLPKPFIWHFTCFKSPPSKPNRETEHFGDAIRRWSLSDFNRIQNIFGFGNRINLTLAFEFRGDLKSSDSTAWQATWISRFCRKFVGNARNTAESLETLKSFLKQMKTTRFWMINQDIDSHCESQAVEGWIRFVYINAFREI